jgi:fumarate hydratase class I
LLKLRDGIVELIRKVATSLPPDVEEALGAALWKTETDEGAKRNLTYILKNIKIARSSVRPICQDTGVPVFYVKIPRGVSHEEVKNTIIQAVRVATKRVPLRPNAVDVITEKNSGDNTGLLFPVIYLEQSTGDSLVVDMMLKGSGCENAGSIFKIPDVSVGAERDLDGVRRCVLKAIHNAQGRGCPPYTVGVGIGGAKDQVTALAKRQLMRRLPEQNEDGTLGALELRLLSEINCMGVGPIGLGGDTTAIGVKIGRGHRHPGSYFVDVSLACWASRRGSLRW